MNRSFPEERSWVQGSSIGYRLSLDAPLGNAVPDTDPLLGRMGDRVNSGALYRQPETTAPNAVGGGPPKALTPTRAR